MTKLFTKRFTPPRRFVYYLAFQPEKPCVVKKIIVTNIINANRWASIYYSDNKSHGWVNADAINYFQLFPRRSQNIIEADFVFTQKNIGGFGVRIQTNNAFNFTFMGEYL